MRFAGSYFSSGRVRPTRVSTRCDLEIRSRLLKGSRRRPSFARARAPFYVRGREEERENEPCMLTISTAPDPSMEGGDGGKNSADRPASHSVPAGG